MESSEPTLRAHERQRRSGASAPIQTTNPRYESRATRGKSRPSDATSKFGCAKRGDNSHTLRCRDPACENTIDTPSSDAVAHDRVASGTGSKPNVFWSTGPYRESRNNQRRFALDSVACNLVFFFSQCPSRKRRAAALLTRQRRASRHRSYCRRRSGTLSGSHPLLTTM